MNTYHFIDGIDNVRELLPIGTYVGAQHSKYDEIYYWASDWIADRKQIHSVVAVNVDNDMLCYMALRGRVTTISINECSPTLQLELR